MEKRVAIIGAGISGLLACKYTLDKGFQPVVFESQSTIGGVWAQTIESTKLQTPKHAFQFSNLPWPSYVKDLYPTHTQVMEYIESYAQQFNLLPFIRFGCEVIGMDFFGVSEEEMELWDLWGGNGRPFSPKGKWLLQVKDKKRCSQEEYKFEFVILCMGRYSGSPNIPDEFPLGHDAQTFNGKVVHSMEYSAMDDANVKEMIKGKRIVVVGAQKSALDIAAECANVNGIHRPCTMIERTVNWAVPSSYSNLDFLFLSRFSELMVHKPNETFLHTFLATLLSPLRWAISKLVESYLRCELPLSKYNMVPKHSFMEQFSSCKVPILPDNFYRMVEEGSIILKKSQSLSFCSEGLVIDGEVEPLQTDVVILATGFKSDEKLKNIFVSRTFQQYIKGPLTTQVPLYRQIIHPRIPQLAIIGFSESLSNLHAFEIQCRWLAHFLYGSFELHGIREMEKEIVQWENYTKRCGGKFRWRSCCIAIPIWYNDQMCRDMGCEPKRKKGFFAEWFEPYGPLDYVGLTMAQ
ncbi:hypothetical protein Vadar_018981 [Vaccinium darrowii]|uniref:Uncharacterized protein n=1 Tax=Vaccinium darrowii TaxID=229202 RepID=A0ACB7YQ01_9ERIC|nr:hypothetical protein Vadar_018981 [Vaccinium darrowii]